jgi:hypothetical protein
VVGDAGTLLQSGKKPRRSGFLRLRDEGSIWFRPALMMNSFGGTASGSRVTRLCAGHHSPVPQSIPHPEPFGALHRWGSAYRVLLAPCCDRHSVDFFAVRAFDEVHHASLPHQKTSLTHRILLGGECSAHTFTIRSWIEIVSGPSHAVLERRTEQRRRSEPVLT